VPSVAWISSSASRTGSTSDWPRGERFHVAADPHQQWIVEIIPQAVQRRAHRRCDTKDLLRRPCDVPFTQQGVERDQQVQIETMELHTALLERLLILPDRARPSYPALRFRWNGHSPRVERSSTATIRFQRFCARAAVDDGRCAVDDGKCDETTVSLPTRSEVCCVRRCWPRPVRSSSRAPCPPMRSARSRMTLSAPSSTSSSRSDCARH